MKFVDSVKIHVRSGPGGPGCTAFRREKFVPLGGPSGGDGGKGGDVYFVGDPNKTTLLDLSFQQHQHAESGFAGGGQDRHGRAGHDLHISVPLGTVVLDEESREVMLEVVAEKPYRFLDGGRGGRGVALLRPFLLRCARGRGDHRHEDGLRDSFRLERLPRQCLRLPVPPGAQRAVGVEDSAEFR